MVDLRAYIADQPILDVHEHHMPATLLNREVGLLQLLRESYAGWTQQRPYPVGTEEPPPAPASDRPQDWRDIAPFVERSGSSTFVRNVVWALGELYGVGDEGLTEDNWRSVDEEIRRRHADPSWVPSVLDRAGVRRVITDPYLDPLMDARATLGPRYQSVFRINALAVGWHADSRDHNGNSAHEYAQRLGRRLASFEDYLAFLEVAVDTMGDRHQVGLKNALAYDREIQFDDIDEQRAREAWGLLNPTPEQRKAFGDVVVDRLARLAGERDIPFQMHLGTARIRGSHPLNAAGLIERHPRTRFLLMHLAYPWSSELLALAFVYRNIWLDLTWGALLSPTHFKRALHEAIEILPDETRLMVGGDNWHVEETFGTLSLVRHLIGQVLQEKLDTGYLRQEGARRLARRILHENAASFFRLS
jgi:hypothetical protein